MLDRDLAAAIIDVAGSLVMVMDGEGRIERFNRSAEELTGWTFAELRGHRFWDFLIPDDCVDAYRERFRDLLFMSRPQASEAEWLTRAGERRLISWTTAAVTSPDGRTHVVATGIDITEQRATETALRCSEERFRALVQHASDVISVISEDGSLVYTSPAATAILGLPDEALSDVASNPDPLSVFHPDDAAAVRQQYAEALASPGLGRPFEYRLQRSDGRWVHVESTANNLLDNPAVGGIVFTTRDVSTRKRAEELLAGQTRILAMVARAVRLAETLDALARLIETQIDGSTASILLLDPDGVTLRPGASPNVPAPLTAAIGEGFAIGPSVGSCGTAAWAGAPVVSADIATDPAWAAWREVALASGIGSSWSLPIRGTGDVKVLGTLAVYHDRRHTPTPEDWRSLTVLVDLAGIAIERSRAEAHLSYQARHDPLTGLSNRLMFVARLDEALASSAHRPGAVAVLFLDLDRFKIVNDSLGHDAGDQILVAVAERLLKVVRKEDMASRFGGDEFTILCDDVADLQEVVGIADRIAEAVARPFTVGDAEVFLTASIGIAISSGPGDRAETLLGDADAAMYRAKDRGKARYELFDEAMRAHAVERLRTENDLHRAIDRGELRAHFQPEYSLADGGIVALEALVRWQHPERGLLPPGAFVPHAEESGLIVPLGRWILEEACRQARIWREAFPDRPPVRVWVNLSARQLTHANLVDTVSEALAATGTDPDQLGLEVTESVLMADAEAAIAILRQLRALGVHLGVDDFGTGYSSLSYLKRFPVDVLKIDRSFVHGLGHDAEDTAIVAAIIGMADALGLTTVAEGVETAEQLAELRRLGCRLGQGFYFAMPQSAMAIDEILRAAVVTG